MPRHKRGTDLQHWKSSQPAAQPGKLRIIGGHFRGRQLAWSGDLRTRPMKDNIREAVFNLVGGWLKDKQVIDLFAGSGAIGLEALSRGAAHVTMIERHFPTAKIIRENVAELGAQEQTTIVTSDTFFWSRQFLSDATRRPTEPWAVFCSPPYDLYVDKQHELLTMLAGLFSASPPHSLFVVESDDRFDPEALPHPDDWKIRQYAPAQICVLRPSVDDVIDQAWFG
ncbi:MAG: RsmD family RNA methyltransferase [Pirellulaceae bacterium]